MQARDRGVTLAELLAAFSLATDLGLGQPMEHLLRAWRIARGLADRLGVAEGQRDALFYVAMLSWVGCVADAPEVAASFGDDIAFRADSYGVDLGGLSGFGFFVGHAAAGRPVPRRVRAAATLVLTGGRQVVRGIQSHCLTTATLAERLGLEAEVGAALRQFFTRWDGRGVPAGSGAADGSVLVHLFHVADVVEVHHRHGGLDAALAVARARRGRQFAPSVVDAFCAHARTLLDELEDIGDLHRTLAAEPALARRLSEQELDAALEGLADFTDLRSGRRAGHSRGVGELAGSAGRVMGLPGSDQTVLRRAGLVHDIGLHGVPVTILDKPAPLSVTEWERVRLSAYYTERVLARPAALARIGAVAALAHERLDGSGYHRGIGGGALPMTGRILAAACAYRAMLEPRAHRSALTVKTATAMLRGEARAGRLDADAVHAVLTAAGVGGQGRRRGPAGLTPREVEVLGLIARGAATSEVAARLGISRKTAGTHIERIYAKTGASSRSTATLFALRNGLLDPLDS
ncbi:HD domain-containing protein [Amycolatopsis sp. K13G38]|uniref:HD domain-containing protein n=1 Tax=Amycolatopsis acididurans TaxID=2724524 RepID=A0ABX1J889_9PSEU|nr:HD domain-containing phosphohydrolase [Amycolatopsis acididurans]NKQ56013.1 HD domain-containing protein [Amycolatopsis acididurans]